MKELPVSVPLEVTVPIEGESDAVTIGQVFDLSHYVTVIVTVMVVAARIRLRDFAHTELVRQLVFAHIVGYAPVTDGQAGALLAVLIPLDRFHRLSSCTVPSLIFGSFPNAVGNSQSSS